MKPVVNFWLYWLLFPLHRLLLWGYFGHIRIRGLSHLPSQGPVILAAKHYSRWDPVVLALLSSSPLWFMANANQFEGAQGWFIKRLGAFPVDIARPKLSSFRTAIDLLRSGKKLVIFPEGGIVRDQPLQTLKTGLARLVLQAETKQQVQTIPIVPISLRYHPDAVVNAKIDIYIGPPLYSQNYDRNSDRETAEALTKALERSLRDGLTAIEQDGSNDP